MKKLFKLLKYAEGIEIVEWALMAALFALGCAAAIVLLTGGVSAFFQNIADYLSGIPVPT